MSLIKLVKKLRIKEDTACVASKTSYISEDGFDKNGIYYFGKKPNLPINWKEYKKKDKITKRGVVEMIIKESYDDVRRYFEVESKQVKDSDGFWNDYTMYEEYVIPKDEWYNFLKNYKDGVTLKDEWFNRYVFVFGDKELYDPNDGYDEWDYECESEQEAYDWFEDYNGFDEYDECLETKPIMSESISDESGMFMQLDDVVDGFTGNMSEEDIDKAIRYLNKVTSIIGEPNNYSDVTYYICADDWLDPIQKKEDFELRRIYKNGKYDGYVGKINGKTFVVDHFDTRGAFGLYADDEDTIRKVIEYMNEGFE